MAVSRVTSAISLILLTVTSVVSAQAPLPPGGKIVPGVEFEKWSTSGDSIANFARREGGIDFQVRTPGKNAYDATIHSPALPISLRKGDRIVLAIQTTKAAPLDSLAGVNVYLEKAQGDWEGFGSSEWVIGSKPTDRYLTVEAPRDLPAGVARYSIHLASVPQTSSLTNARVMVYPRELADFKAPFNAISYPGEEKNAPWRKEAEARIDRIRKGRLTIKVLDAAGKPVPSAQVDVKQKRLGFEIGSFIEEPLLEKSADGERYRAVFSELFNKVTVPMYWADWGWASPEKRKQYLEYCDYFQKAGVPIKGHLIIYPGWQFLPESARKLKDRPSELRKLFDAHVVEKLNEVRRYNFVSWDVTNELRDLPDLFPILGFDYFADLFKQAKQLTKNEANPPRLYINENSIVESGGATEANQTLYESQIRELISKGAPIEGIGIQGHFGERVTGPETLWKILDRFAKFGVPIQITEFDVNTFDEEGHGRYFEDFYTAMFAHPSLTGVTMWGFWEKSMWMPNGALFGKDWREKPAATALRRLIKRWRTDFSGKSNAAGNVSLRAYKGTLTVEVTVGSKREVAEVDLNESEKETIIRLK